MTNVRDFLKQCPPGTTFTRDAVLELLDGAGEIEEGSPGQVARALGRSPRYWRERAEAQEIDGAYRDPEPDGRWRVPLAACRAHLARKRETKSGGLRGPRRRKATTAPTSRTRTASVPKGPVLLSGSQTVGRRARGDAGSHASGLAAGGGAN